MNTKRTITDHLSRRTALTGVATVGLGVPFLAACGSSDSTATDSAGSGSSGDAAPGAGAPAGSAAAGPLATTADVEVGGGEVLQDQQVVLTQPTAGEFKCFTAVCTHSGCLVSEVTSEGIQCTCHGSLFSAEDGSVISGPAPSALDAVDITVTGDQITLA